MLTEDFVKQVSHLHPRFLEQDIHSFIKTSEPWLRVCQDGIVQHGHSCYDDYLHSTSCYRSVHVLPCLTLGSANNVDNGMRFRALLK